MGTVPSVPSFTTGDSSMANLQNLSAAVAWLANYTVRPAFHFWRINTFSYTTTSTYVTVPMIGNNGTWLLDTDSMFSGSTTGIADINTQGIWKFEACVPLIGASAQDVCQVVFTATGGTHNPHLASGVANRFGGKCTNMSGTAGTYDSVMCISDICPIALYPGDTVAVQIWCTSALTVDNAHNNQPAQGWFIPSFSGRWIAIGS